MCVYHTHSPPLLHFHGSAATGHAQQKIDLNAVGQVSKVVLLLILVFLAETSPPPSHDSNVLFLAVT